MKVKLLTIICVIALIFGVVAVGCTGEVTPPAEQEEEEEEEEEEVFELTLGTWDPPEIAMYRVAFTAWERWLEEESNGRLKITVLYSETLAKSAELHDACAAGLCDMAVATSGRIPERYRVSEVTTLPLLFKFPGSLTAGLTGTEMYKKYGEYIDAEWGGVKMVGFHANGASHVITTDKQVKVLEDFEGLILMNLTFPGYAEALGFVPESLSPGEIYDALAKGVVDGAVGEYEGDYVHQTYNLSKYHTEVGINVTGLFQTMMNLDTWNSLPADLQALFQGENMDLHTYINGYNFDRDDVKSKELIREYWLARGVENGGIYVLPDEERQRWIDALMPLRDAWVADAEARGAPGRDMLDDVVMWADEYYKPSDELCPWCEDWFIEWYGEDYTELEP